MGFSRTVRGNEDLVLAELDRAESGDAGIGLGRPAVYLDMYPDGRVVIEPTERLLEDDQQDNPPQIVITIAEARKLILGLDRSAGQVVRGSGSAASGGGTVEVGRAGTAVRMFKLSRGPGCANLVKPRFRVWSADDSQQLT